MSRFTLFQAASAADDAWMAEIVRVFGAAGAGRARVQGRAAGEPGSALRALHDLSMTTREAYRASRGLA